MADPSKGFKQMVLFFRFDRRNSNSSLKKAIKVVVRAEILPKDFIQTPGNNYLSLTIAKIKRFKKFHGLKIW